MTKPCNVLARCTVTRPDAAQHPTPNPPEIAAWTMQRPASEWEQGNRKP
ncbi:hypothetical protein H6G33_17850 [Calothrix sp. FACHB-1219]|nr:MULTISPECIES: hypothetical protein [unclassified Calothrix]MBD2202743.1 hypothetical protein [Calothrix sp. FACHB-168]MBD2218896.1 hypothetical protein [Calothrix sp. FACHB-1219]